MTIKVEHDGAEIEVYTADEIAAARTEAATAKENEYKPKIAGLEGDLGEARKALNDRAGEFKQFRKLSDEQVAKLTIAEKTIYENGILLQEERDKNAARDKTTLDNLVLTTIKGKVGTDEKVVKKVQDMYSLIGLEANSPQDVEKKVLATLGALGQTEPDFVASINGFNAGSFEPPKAKEEGEKSFADTERGKAGAAELGIVLEAPKK